MPIVLTDSLATYAGEYDHWEDVTGKQYHFPNNYRRYIQPGVPFIYYRGTRAPGNKRIPASYFGRGTIGSVFEDTRPNSKKGKRWYCTILDYQSFPNPVGIKESGEYLEAVFKSRKNQRLNAVRQIDEAVYRKILQLSWIEHGADIEGDEPEATTKDVVTLPLLREVQPRIHEGDTLWTLRRTRLARREEGEESGSYVRRSRFAKVIGDRAEEVVLKYLRSILAASEITTLRWLADEGVTPGYDLAYTAQSGTQRCIEVKGTTADVFEAIQITAQEWQSAKERRENYILALVSDCASSTPNIQMIVDPYRMFLEGHLTATPLLWSLTRI